jgi:hypothetical protein
MATFQRHNSRAAKLNASQVAEIRQLYEEGWSQGRLCREYGMSIGQIGRIVRGESWRDYRMPDRIPTEEEVQASAKRLEALLKQPTKETEK